MQFHHYVQVESFCTVVVKQCMEIKRNIQFFGCIECMRCRLFLPMFAVSVRLSVCQTQSVHVTLLKSAAARAVCAGSFGAAFVKLL